MILARAWSSKDEYIWRNWWILSWCCYDHQLRDEVVVFFNDLLQKFVQIFVLQVTLHNSQNPKQHSESKTTPRIQNTSQKLKAHPRIQNTSIIDCFVFHRDRMIMLSSYWENIWGKLLGVATAKCGILLSWLLFCKITLTFRKYSYLSALKTFTFGKTNWTQLVILFFSPQFLPEDLNMMVFMFIFSLICPQVSQL